MIGDVGTSGCTTGEINSQSGGSKRLGCGAAACFSRAANWSTLTA